MQAGGGGCNGTCMAGKDSLIIGGVLRIGGAFGRNIGRQRHQPAARQTGVEIRAGQVEVQLQIGVGFGNDGCHQIIREPDIFADRHFAQGFGQRAPALRHRIKQSDLYFGHRIAAPAGAKQPRRDHAGVVQNQPVTGAKDIHQIIDMAITDCIPLRQQQPRRCARVGGPGGD